MDTRTVYAFDALKFKMQQDTERGSYAHAWHCNIAMSCLDAMKSDTKPGLFNHGQAYKTANDAASRFMKLCFDVDTKA